MCTLCEKMGLAWVGEVLIELLGEVHLVSSHVDGFSSPVGSCALRNSTFPLNKLEIVVANVSGIIVGDMDKYSKYFATPGVNETVEGDAEFLEFVMPIC